MTRALCVAMLWLVAFGIRPVRAQEQPPRLIATPVVLQHATLFLSDDVTTGGVGGGLGVVLSYRARYLLQADVGALWMFGNVLSTRIALGAQWGDRWSPAAWLTAGALFGDRLEFLTDEGQRPAVPTWAVGVRVSPLRFVNARALIAALEPGIATDFSGGLWLELTVLQAGAAF